MVDPRQMLARGRLRSAAGAAVQESAEEEPEEEGYPFGVGEVSGKGGDKLH